MKLTVAVTLLLLLVPPSQAASPTLSFASPAQIQGNINATDVQWVLLIFHGPGTAFQVHAEGESTTNHTTTVSDPRYPGIFDGPPSPLFLPGTSVEWRQTLDAKLDFQQPWASLYVAAASIQISLVDADGYLQTSSPGQSMDQHRPDSIPPVGTYRGEAHRVGNGGVAFGAEPSSRDGQINFQLTARGLQMLEWHNATLTCAAVCLDGAGTSSYRQQAPFGTQSFHLMHSLELQTQDGTLNGIGQAWELVFGGGPLNVTFQGTGRFPQARVEGCQGPCPGTEDQTFLPEGTIELIGLHRDGDRLSAGMQGTLTAARFDESSVSPKLFGLDPAAAAVGVAAAVGFAVAVRWFLAFLFSRLHPGDVSGVRGVVLDAIRANPGVGPTDLMAATGLSRTPLDRHLKRLVASKLVAVQRRGKRLLYFDGKGGPGEDWKDWSVLRKDALAKLHSWLLAHPGLTQEQIRNQLHQESGANPTTTHYRLRALLEAGVATREPDTRKGVFHAIPPPTLGSDEPTAPNSSQLRTHPVI